MKLYHLYRGPVLAASLIATAILAKSENAYFRSDLGLAKPSTKFLPATLDSTTLVWRSPLDRGQSTPVLAGGKIFLTTHNAELRELATVALDQETGKQLWKQSVKVEKIEEFHPSRGDAAVATPACDGKRLFIFFGSYGLICYDVEGNKLWDKRMGPFHDEYGAGSSPILVDDMVVLSQDHDTDSFVAAYDKVSGDERWRTARPDAVRSYSTPVIWERSGKREILVAGALELTSYDPKTGKRLWFKRGLARIVIPLPIPSGDRIYMASWSPGGDRGLRIALEPWGEALQKWDGDKDHLLVEKEIENREVLTRFFRMDLNKSGTLDQNEWERHAAVFERAENAVLGLKPSAEGELPESDVLWKYEKGIPYVATPVLSKGLFWMAKDGGIVTRVDVSDGSALERERLPGHGSYLASPVAGDGKVYFADDRGTVSVVADQREWKVLSSYNFKEKIHGSPVIDGERLYIRTEEALYSYRGLDRKSE
jgi:outer membrane protein assembly factor BamB